MTSTTISVSAEGYDTEIGLSVTHAIPMSVAVDPPSVHLTPDQTTHLTATLTWSDDREEEVTDDAQWTSGVPSIVEVLGPGEIHGGAVGGTEVFASYSAHGASANGKASVTVTE